MGMHSLEELIRLYTLGKISAEQAIGQMLQHLLRMESGGALERIERLEQEIKRLKAFVGMEPEVKSKKKKPRQSEVESTDEASDPQ